MTNEGDEMSAVSRGSVANYPAKPDGWIPVTERLPEDLQRVIAYFAGVGIDEVGEAVFNKAGGWFSTEHGAWDASHWMPMPEPPAQ